MKSRFLRSPRRICPNEPPFATTFIGPRNTWPASTTPAGGTLTLSAPEPTTSAAWPPAPSTTTSSESPAKLSARCPPPRRSSTSWPTSCKAAHPARSQRAPSPAEKSSFASALATTASGSPRVLIGRPHLLAHRAAEKILHCIQLPSRRPYATPAEKHHHPAPQLALCRGTKSRPRSQRSEAGSRCRWLPQALFLMAEDYS